ncbi:MAG: hypothetical protein HY722_04755 [Planctomycetes bacterium]|nr:hypothetical protein [Planctomycetota bacterium]
MTDDRSTDGPAPQVRIEARPLRASELTRGQAKVIHDATRWLASFCSGAPAADEASRRELAPAFLPRFDAERRSNVVLIDGARGSGKTSVFLTLLRLWGSSLRLSGGSRGTRPAEGTGWFCEGDPPPDADTAKNVELLLKIRDRQPLKGQVVPLHPLDLQPLPPSTSLLAWLASRLHDVVDSLVGEEETGTEGYDLQESRPSASFLMRELACEAAWRRLIRAIAAGWDGNIEDRRGRVDPEAYAVEREDAERARLRVPESWRVFIDDLLSDLRACYGLGPDGPLLVLPIDDADTNPARCVELLNLVRTLWHERVVFLLTGDSDLFRETLRMDCLGAIQRPLRDLKRLGDAVTDFSAAPAVARDLAAAIYDKVVPPAHRFRLAGLDPVERVHLLETTLKKVPIMLPPDVKSPETLLGYFALPLGPGGEMVPTQAADGLPETMREILDLQGQAFGEGSAAALILFLWRRALASAWLHNADRGRISYALSCDPLGRLHFDTTQLGSGTTVRGLWNFSYPSDGTRTILVGRRTGFTHCVRGQKGRDATEEKSTRYLDKHLNGILIVATDLVADSEKASFTGAPPTPPPFQSGPVESSVLVTWRREDPSGARVAPTVLGTRWPVPQWHAYHDFVPFDHGWAQVTDGFAEDLELLRHQTLNVPPRVLDSLGRGFLDLICKIAESRSIPALSEAGPVEPPAWSELARRVVKLSATMPNSARGFINQHWARDHALLLATPESGLPNESASEFLQAVKGTADEDTWSLMCIGAGRARRARIMQTVPGMSNERDADGICRAIDDQFGGDIAEWIEERPREHADLQTALRSIQVVHPEGASAKSPNNLQAYLKELGGLAALRRLEPEEAAGLERLAAGFPIPGMAGLFLAEAWTFLVGRRSMQPKVRAALASYLTWTEEAGLRLSGAEPTFEGAEPVTVELDGDRAMVLPNRASLRAVGLADPVLEALWLLAHEVRADEHDLDAGKERPAARVWLKPIRCVFTIRGDRIEVPWPMPAWPAALDAVLVFRTLAPLLEQVRVAAPGLKRLTGPRRQDIADGVAWAVVRAITSVSLGRAVAGPDDVMIAPRDVRGSLGAAYKEVTRWSVQQATSGMRIEAIRDWLSHDFPLLAAPEFGLSPGLAKAILDAWGHGPGEIEGQEVQQRRLRRFEKALGASGRDPGNATQLLAEIDAKAPDHPWVAWFHSRTRSR